MDDLYDYMKSKLEEMRSNRELAVSVDYVEFARLYQLVCFMKQIKTLVNGLDEVVKRDA